MLRPKLRSKTWPENNSLEPSEAGKYFLYLPAFLMFLLLTNSGVRLRICLVIIGEVCVEIRKGGARR